MRQTAVVCRGYRQLEATKVTNAEVCTNKGPRIQITAITGYGTVNRPQ